MTNESSSESNSSDDPTYVQTHVRQEINCDNYKIMLTNARSLSPKIESLHTYFEEHELDFAMITESWLKDGSVLDRDVVDLEHGADLKIIYKNRPRTGLGARKVGGGVSIIFEKNKCNFRERKVVGNNFELVAAVGKIGKIKRQIAILCMYIEPRTKVGDLEKLNELLSREILSLKAGGDPLFFIGGDLNKKSIDVAMADFPDIRRINHLPNRGNACLNVLFSNSSSLTERVWPPLANREGTLSDHMCTVFSGAEKKERNFRWARKSVRRHTDQAVAEFGAALEATNWSEVLPDEEEPGKMVAAFEKYTSGMVERLFPLKSVRYRDNEAPWMTEGIRRLSKRKRRVFKREGKSPFWFRLCDKMLEAIEKSKTDLVDRVAASGTSSRSYYSTVKALGTRSGPTNWQLTDLFPDASPAEAGEQAASFFTRITDLYQPLQPEPPMGPRRRPLTLPEVEKLLRDAKKPSSTVKGDLLPRLVKAHHKLIAPAALRIFNAVLRSGTWPQAWKTETVVVIPKVPNPTSLTECRNISCTAFLSKVLETVVLGDLREAIPDDTIQYGGLKGSSVDHLLVDLMDRVLGPLEDGDPTVITGIDFEKAFNRLDHAECLIQLRQLGAADHSIQLVRSFLTGRKMRVKVGDQLSSEHGLSGGSPQGSILGCYLYCAVTQQLNTSLLSPQPPPLSPSGPRTAT